MATHKKHLEKLSPARKTKIEARTRELLLQEITRQESPELFQNTRNEHEHEHEHDSTPD